MHALNNQSLRMYIYGTVDPRSCSLQAYIHTYTVYTRSVLYKSIACTMHRSSVLYKSWAKRVRYHIVNDPWSISPCSTCTAELKLQYSIIVIVSRLDPICGSRYAYIYIHVQLDKRARALTYRSRATFVLQVILNL